MNKHILPLLLLLCTAFTTNAHAQNIFNTDAFWQRVILDKQPLQKKFTTADTVIIVASNRIMQDSSRFMGEACDTVVRCFVVYSMQGKWHVAQVHNITQATTYLPDRNRDWVIYTEGMGKLFTSELERGMLMSAVYNINVLMQDYPSISTTMRQFKNYKFALHNAKTAYKDFVPVMDTMKMLHQNHQLGTGHMTLFFHSMGNNVMRELVKNNRLPVLNDQVWVDNLVLNAACVPQRHHKQWLDQVKFAQHIYVHYNPKDRSLSLAHLASFKKQLGEKVKRPLSAQAIYINFHPLCDRGHSNFLSLPGRQPIASRAYEHYNVVLRGNAVDIHNASLYTTATYRHIGWDLLP